MQYSTPQPAASLFSVYLFCSPTAPIPDQSRIALSGSHCSLTFRKGMTCAGAKWNKHFITMLVVADNDKHHMARSRKRCISKANARLQPWWLSITLLSVVPKQLIFVSKATTASVFLEAITLVCKTSPKANKNASAESDASAFISTILKTTSNPSAESYEP